jgi:hypothetical protein
MKKLFSLLIMLVIACHCFGYNHIKQTHVTRHKVVHKIKHKAKKKHKKSKKDKDPKRCALPTPFDNIFPISEYIGPILIGVPDTDPEYPLTKSLWQVYPGLKEAKVKVFGWLSPGFNVSSSKHSNVPLGYDIVPNRLQLQQFVLRLARNPDTVQRCCIDWGFHFSNLFGIDYRNAIAQGIFSDQLIKHNLLYGYIPLELYGEVYFPSVAQGMVVTFGYFSSPADIESTLSTDNFLFTHSIMVDYDISMLTGITWTIKLNNYWSFLVGTHAGGDTAPWAKGSHIPSFLAMARWVSCDNNDSLWGGIDCYNGGKFRGDQDNLQEFSLAWTHRFTKKFFIATQVYYIYQIDSPVGGTCIFGPIKYGAGGGCGPIIPGYSSEIGAVNFIELKTSDKDFISFRSDYLGDFDGARTGFATSFLSFTFGLTHVFNELIQLRPEIRYDTALSKRPYDNGTKKSQGTFNIDLILRF